MATTKAPAAPPAASVDKWTFGIPKDPTDPQYADWNAYDAVIQDTVRTYDGWLNGKGGYVAGITLSWLLVKAMCWTETGAASDEWSVRPAQIGVVKGGVADPGILELLSRKPKTLAVLPPDYAPGGKLAITVSNARTDPTNNIHAGVGYLLLQAARTGFLSELPAKTPPSPYTVVARDNPSRIAAKAHTTLQELQQDNPGKLAKLHPGDALLYKPAAEHIIGWHNIDAAFVAATYNTADVATYTYRVNYCLSILQSKAQAK